MLICAKFFLENDLFRVLALTYVTLGATLFILLGD